MSAEARLAAKLAELNLQLPPAPAPIGAYKTLAIVGNMVYTSGHPPIDSAGKLITGRVGEDLDVAAGYAAARLAGLCILASIRKEFGGLDRIHRVIKILGAVNCTSEFTQQAAVINGCSELFAEIFGPESGIAARSAIGVNTLPLGICVEIEAIFELH
jgi:enamine deaminase RidA (YjgF/YER057c/UK114 family)